MKRCLSLVPGLAVMFALSGCETSNVHELAGTATPTALVHANDTVQVKSMDNQQQDAVFIGQQHRYVVAPGRHAWIVQYSDIFFAGDSHEIVSSSPLRVVFDAQPGGEYVFTHEPQPNIDAAKAFAQSPVLNVLDQTSGSLVPVTVEQGQWTGFLSQDPAALATIPAEGRLQRLKQLWNEASPEERDAFRTWLSLPR